MKAWFSKTLGSVVAGVSALLPVSAMAQSATFQPLENAATSIWNFMSGTFGTTVSFIAVAVVGFMCFSQRWHWGALIAVGFGIVLIFGAPQFVAMIKNG